MIDVLRDLEGAYKKYGLIGGLVYCHLAKYVAIIPIKFGVSPNTVTVLGFVVFCIGAWLLFVGTPWVAALGFVVLQVGVVFDYVDGLVARTLQKTSFFGGWLDNCLDRLADFILMLLVAVRLLEGDSCYGEWTFVVAITGAFAVMFSHYMHDIGYFFRVGRPPTSSGSEAKAATIWHRAPSVWLRIFNRDSVVLVLSVALLAKTYAVPYAFVLAVSLVNMAILLAKELYQDAIRGE